MSTQSQSVAPGTPARDEAADLFRAHDLADPDALSSVAELRAELMRANRAILRLAELCAATQAALLAISAEIAPALCAHLRGDGKAVRAELGAFIERRVTVCGRAKGGVH